MSFSVESVGIARGEGLPASVQQPTPVYPVLEVKPLPLSGGEQVEYLLALKQEFRGAMRSLPCFLQPPAKGTDVERYSDKYHNNDQQGLDWTPDWRTLPKELRVRPLKPRPSGPSPAPRQTEAPQKKQASAEKEEVLLKLETLEQKETGSDEEEEEKKQDEEEAEEEEYDEEELEEETDYIMSYFDNGEDFGADSDDNMDEAIY